MKHCATSMIRRRSKLSASAPDTSEKSMIGSEVDACTSATMFAEEEIEVISQAAPTDWMRPPKLDARLAIQIVRKMSCLKGASGEIRWGTSSSLLSLIVVSKQFDSCYRPEHAKCHPLKLTLLSKIAGCEWIAAFAA